MNLLVRAIVMGFGMAAGAALYKRVSRELGWEGEKAGEPAVDPAEAPPHPPVEGGGSRGQRGSA